MGTKNFVITSLIIIFMSCCVNDRKESNEKTNTPKLDSLLIKKVPEIASEAFTLEGIPYKKYKVNIEGIDGYHVEVTTEFLDDTLKSKQSTLFDQNDIVTAQTLSFFYNDSLLNESKYECKKGSRIFNEKKISVLDNVILQGGFVRGEKDFFYDFYGSGGCNNCSEKTTFYSKNGKILWSIYSKNSDNFLDEKYEFDEVARTFLIPDSTIKSKRINMLYIYPIDRSGISLSSSIK